MKIIVDSFVFHFGPHANLYSNDDPVAPRQRKKTIDSSRDCSEVIFLAVRLLRLSPTGLFLSTFTEKKKKKRKQQQQLSKICQTIACKSYHGRLFQKLLKPLSK